jgi:hypothetical protein
MIDDNPIFLDSFSDNNAMIKQKVMLKCFINKHILSENASDNCLRNTKGFQKPNLNAIYFEQYIKNETLKSNFIFINFFDYICDKEFCRPNLGETWLHGDNSHLSYHGVMVLRDIIKLKMEAYKIIRDFKYVLVPL